MAPILKVAVLAPFLTTFDYLPPESSTDVPLRPGIRLKVPLGHGTRIGILTGLETTSTVAPERLRPVLEILDLEPLLRPADLNLLQWAARYYHHPVGEVFAAALPGPLRRGQQPHIRPPLQLRLTATGAEALLPARASRQATLLQRLKQREGILTADELAELEWNWRPTAKALAAKGFIELEEAEAKPLRLQASPFHPNPAQRQAIDTIRGRLGDFAVFLLEGVTGSGKTEVYLQTIETVLTRGQQALVLLPEIALTPQLKSRFQQRLGGPVGVYHSGLSEDERLKAWLGFQRGDLPLLLGTRSAVFIPMARPGLIVVDEEHDPSFKQQEGFRFSARDVAIARARQLGIPIVLGSATPSLESLHNARQGRYHHLHLPQRAGKAHPPELLRIDLRNRKLQAGLASVTCEHIQATLARGEQVLLFLNRRGFAPTLICHACGWVAECQRCDARLVVHRREGRLRCHHCGHERPLPATCHACGSRQLRPLGRGTERLETELGQLFPQARIARIDRDAVRRKGSLEETIRRIQAGEIDFLLGTQMLAKGHHFPNVTLAVILDADTGLYSTDFRAPERMAQSIVQVAGRAGRAAKPGKVLIQTRHPDHPLLTALIERGYPAFAAQALEERRQARLPPFSHQALLRAEAHRPALPHAFLDQAAQLADRIAREVHILGPVPAPMAKRAGRYRVQLLLQAERREPLHRLLDRLLPQLAALPGQRQIRWSLDVDPVELD